MNLKQLAAELGLSQTTVSRALNGYPEVAEATRAKVLRAAGSHNYAPNARARGLATGRAMAIGHMIAMADQREVMNPIFADFVAGAGDVYAAHGYALMLSMVSDGDQERAYRDALAMGRVDGVILQSIQAEDPRIAFLQDIGLPFVVHGRSIHGPDNYDWVDVNNRRAFRRAAEFLLDLGHSRIAFINGRRHQAFAQRRQQGFTDALLARGLRPDPDLTCFDEMTEVVGFRAARAMLARTNPPTAFLTSSIVTALGVRRALEAAGLRLGRDVSVITHDDDLSYLKNGDDVPIFTSVRSAVREAGKLCAQRMIELLQAPNQAPRSRILEAEFLVGASTGPAPALQR